MKKSVKYSGWSWFLTSTMTILCIVLPIVWYNDGKYEKAIVLAVLLAVMIILAMFYAPLYVKITDSHIAVRRLLKSRVINIDDVAAVQLCPPTMGAARVCGSGGWFGYWGWFKERDLGKYFAYYGRSTDCFLVQLKDNRQYVIGCTDAPDVVESILRHIN